MSMKKKKMNGGVVNGSVVNVNRGNGGMTGNGMVNVSGGNGGMTGNGVVNVNGAKGTLKKGKTAKVVGLPITFADVCSCKAYIYAVGRKRDFTSCDCEDLLQEVAKKCAVNPNIRYNSARGKLSTYLTSIAGSTAKDMKRARKVSLVTGETEFNEGVAYKGDEDAEGTMNEAFFDGEKEMVYRDETEWHLKLLNRGLETMHREFANEKFFQAFKMFSQDEKSAKEVARILGVTENYVNTAVFRGKKRLREIVLKMAWCEENGEAC